MQVAGVTWIVMEFLQGPQQLCTATALPYPFSGSVNAFGLQRCSDFHDKRARLAVNAPSRFDQTSERLHSRWQLPLGFRIGESGEPPEVPPVRARQIATETSRERFRRVSTC